MRYPANCCTARSVGSLSPDIVHPTKRLYPGFLTLYLYISEGDARHVVLALWSALCVIYPTDVLRLRSRRFAKIYEKLLGFLMRAEERVRPVPPSSRAPVLSYAHSIGSMVSSGTSSASTSPSRAAPLTWPPCPSSCAFVLRHSTQPHSF
jgi:hypothetical protein